MVCLYMMTMYLSTSHQNEFIGFVGNSINRNASYTSLHSSHAGGKVEYGLRSAGGPSKEYRLHDAE